MKNRLSDSLYFQRNLEYWNEVTPIHAWSAFYDVDGFRSGKTSLHSIELEELGDVSGKSMLHLQCHFGLDTLSWARMGARVTGVDFSDKAIKLARSLSSELGIEASFINSNVYDLPNKLKGQFDVVFTSYGVLCWLPDLEEWARVIGHFLKPGGTFYMAEDHPFATILRESNHDRGLELDSPYFHSNEPEKSSKPMSYTGSSARIASPNYEWPHTLGDVVEALVGAGLRIESLHEFPVCAWQRFPSMTQDADGWWRLEGDRIPLTFSVKATLTPTLSLPGRGGLDSHPHPSCDPMTS